MIKQEEIAPMLNLVTAISSVYAVQGVSLSAAGAGASTYTSAAASQGPTSGAGTASRTSAQAGGTSASTANAASASSAPGATPSASASSKTSAAGVASADVTASSGVAASKTRASPKSSASGGSLDRHFALGMQKSAGAYASDRLSSMTDARSDASDTAASLEISEKRFRNLVSQIALSGGLASSTAEDDQGDPSADGSDASTAGAQAVYADHAA